MRYAFAIIAATFFAGPVRATDLPRIFITSTTGTATLSTWPDAHGMTGLAAGDEICRTRAAAAGIADAASYIAFLSDDTNDAYCRLHGLTGKRADQCGQAAMPVGAGPWYRMDDLPAFDVAELSMTPAPEPGYVPRPIVYDEFGVPFPSTYPRVDSAFTATSPAGIREVGYSTCQSWTGNSQPPFTGGMSAYGGYGWDTYGALGCIFEARLVCAKAGRHGPALPRKRASTARVVFATAAKGTGDLSSWPLAGNSAGVAAGDAICKASAAAAGLPLAASFKAWLSAASVDAASRFVHDGPWYRVDGVRVTESLAAMLDGNLDAALQADEHGQPLTYYGDQVWTGTLPNGQGGQLQFHCDSWSRGDDGVYGHVGKSYLADYSWSAHGGSGAFICSSPGRLYCFADNDSLFYGDMEP